MAESMDHVPQQSRRDKLRENPDRSSFLPFYDPSDIISTAAGAANPLFSASRFQFHHPNFLDTQIQPDFTNNPLLLNQYCYAAAGFKNEPLSLSLSSQPHPTGSGSGLAPLGPFTGYASILKGSRFLKPAQQLLEELCDVGGLIQQIETNSHTLTHPSIIHHSLHNNNNNNSTLLSMLDEVYRKYKQYYEQIQDVMTSFEYTSGLGNATPYANQAIKAMYKHFKCLKNAILDQLQFDKKTHGDHLCQRSVQNPVFIDHQPVWRPQRGLPERAVSVLRAWLFEHFLHPYPSDTDKVMLAKQTGLSRSQVSNWFINARVRIWKPMVEEIYMLETKQTPKNPHRDHRNGITSNDDLHSSMDNPPSTSNHDAPPKRTRNEFHNVPMGNQDESLNVSYNLSNHPHVGANTNMAGNNGGVSLTLGLHQNDGLGGFSEPFPVGFPIAATRRFDLGIQASSEGYLMGGNFGRDVLGGQLLHDFVG